MRAMTKEFADMVLYGTVRPRPKHVGKGSWAKARRSPATEAFRAAERKAGTHGAVCYGEVGPTVLVDPWSRRDVPPWVAIGDVDTEVAR